MVVIVIWSCSKSSYTYVLAILVASVLFKLQPAA